MLNLVNKEFATMMQYYLNLSIKGARVNFPPVSNSLMGVDAIWEFR